MSTARRGKGEGRSEAIRHAAYGCFRDQGYHETTVDAICRAADISKGTFYWYYPSKQAVFVDILDNWAREVMDEVLQQFEKAVVQPDYVAAVTEALHREAHRGRVIVPLWLEFTVHARREPEIQEALSRFYSRARSAIAEMLRPWVGTWMTEAELRGVAGAILGAYTGVMVQDVADPDGADAKEAMRQLMTFLGRLFEKTRRAKARAAGEPPAPDDIDSYLEGAPEEVAKLVKAALALGKG